MFYSFHRIDARESITAFDILAIFNHGDKFDLRIVIAAMPPSVIPMSAEKLVRIALTTCPAFFLRTPIGTQGSHSVGQQ